METFTFGKFRKLKEKERERERAKKKRENGKRELVVLNWGADQRVFIYFGPVGTGEKKVGELSEWEIPSEGPWTLPIHYQLQNHIYFHLQLQLLWLWLIASH